MSHRLLGAADECSVHPGVELVCPQCIDDVLDDVLDEDDVEQVGSALDGPTLGQALEAVDELRRLTTRRPLSELTEEDGEVLWWRKDPHEGVRPKWPPPRPAGVVCLEEGALWKIHEPEAVDVSWAIGDDYWTPLPKVRS